MPSLRFLAHLHKIQGCFETIDGNERRLWKFGFEFVRGVGEEFRRVVTSNNSLLLVFQKANEELWRDAWVLGENNNQK